MAPCQLPTSLLQLKNMGWELGKVKGVETLTPLAPRPRATGVERDVWNGELVTPLALHSWIHCSRPVLAGKRVLNCRRCCHIEQLPLGLG
jgi:hypothetical protein